MRAVLKKQSNTPPDKRPRILTLVLSLILVHLCLITPAAAQLRIVSFGEDAAGEVYFTVVTSTGEGIYRFEATE